MKLIGKATRGKNSIFYSLGSDMNSGAYGTSIPYCGYGEGWAWGYNGKAPLETAESMLAWIYYKHFPMDYCRYRNYSEPFVREVVARLPDNWELTDKEILQWIENYKKTQPKA